MQAKNGKKIGTCEMCGAHNRELHVMFVGDFVGLACLECHRQLQKCQERRYISTGEMTESAE